MVADRYEIRLPALRLRQGERHIFCFGVDGKTLPTFVSVSRVRRAGANLRGYQRPEVLAHIKAIRRYLESADAMLPNAIVIAFDDVVRFEPYGMDTSVGYSTPGELVIPVDEATDESDRPGWIVDGQQRTAAIRDADVDEFPIAAVAFVASSEAEQRSQFILVNNAKPLPKGLIHELLPDTIGHLPTAYARRQMPALLVSRLNSDDLFSVDDDSPFRGRIATPTAPQGYIKDNSVLRMIEESLSDGALYQYRNADDHSGDVGRMLLHLKIYWNMVRAIFHEDWDLPPRKSRLTHGVGIRAMGYVMDTLTDGVPAEALPNLDLETPLRRLRERCAWSSGSWDFAPDDQRRWNGLQNTPTDVKLLTNFLVRQVKNSKRR